MRRLDTRGWFTTAVLAALPILAGMAIIPPNFRGLLVDEYAYLVPSLSMGSGGPLTASATAIAPNLTPMLAGGASAWLLGGGNWSVRIVSHISLWLTALACAGMAARLGAPTRWAALCALVIAAGPVTLPLGLIFMSDVPFAALVAWSGLAAVSWLRSRSIPMALAVGGLSGLAMMSRPQGVLVAGGCILASWILRDVDRVRIREFLAFALPPAIAVAGLAIWLSRDAASNRSMAIYTEGAFTPSIRSAVKMLVFLPTYAWLYMGFFLIGPAVGVMLVTRSRLVRLDPTARRWGIALALVGPVAVAMLALLGRRMPYMAWGSTVASNGIGGGYRQEYPAIMWWLVTLAVAAASAGLGIVIAAAIFRRGEASDDIDRNSDNDEREPAIESSATRLILVLAALQLIGAAPLGLAFQDERVGFDRYLIPVLVFVAPVVIAGAARVGARFWIALLITLGVGVVSLIGIQDWIAQRRVSWSLAEHLVETGVPIDRLDGGFEWNAAKMGEVPAREPPSVDADWQVTEFAPGIDPEWVIARDPRPGYETVEIAQWRGWTRGGTILVLRRVADGSGST